MSLFKLGLALSTSCCLMGCVAAAPPLTSAEVETREQLSSSKYQPAPREIRDNIETQEVLAQAAFWSHEYNLNPVDLEAAIKFSAVLRKMGNPSRSVEITRTTRALYPKDPYLNAEHAAALIADQQSRSALKILDTALQETPAYGRLWSLKGVALDQMEKYEQARPFYDRALRITPNDPNIMANLGLNYALSGDPYTARQWLSRAASHPNASDGVHANLELVEGLVAQAAPPRSRIPAGYRSPAATQAPIPSRRPLASRAAPTSTPNAFASNLRRAPASTPNTAAGLRQSYTQQQSQSAAAPRQYGAYESQLTAQPTRAPQSAPSSHYRTQQPLRPSAQTAAKAQSPAPQYSQYAAPTAPRAQRATTAYNQAGALQAQQQTQQQAVAPEDVLSRIAKNVGPRTAPQPHSSQAQNYAAQAGYAAAQNGVNPQQYYQQAPQYQSQQQQRPQAQPPQVQGGYPAPASPYYDGAQVIEPPLQRRTAARRRG